MKLTSEIHCIKGKKYHVFQSRLKDVMHTDTPSNPILWFAKEIITRDMLIVGLPRKREVIEYLNEDSKGD
ncbi:MAG: hypothetical protein ACXACY_30990 [Candidatus Hodarchaeales archaeon]